ncbi:MAG: hypothetical protein ACSHYF_14890 [Verrucomicrobiaceae bacterium]
MKTLAISALSLFSTVTLLSGQVASKEPRALIMTEDDTISGFVVASSSKSLRYKETEQSTNFKDVRLSSVNVYFLEPPEFTEAMEVYRNRNYEEASEKFALCAETYKKVDEVKGNYSTLAVFYQMECARKLGNLTKLSEMMSTFIAEPLIRKEHLTQIELNNVFWEAVRTKAWARLIAIGTDPDWQDKVFSGSLRAQINYCMGMAYEGEKEPLKALNAYNGAFVADFSASEVLTRNAALACLRILKDHEAVVLGMKLYGTDDYDEASTGAFLIREGLALVKLWDKSLGGGQKMPEEYKVFLKYAPKEQ